ncbi:MAG: hypothetical protein WC222_05710 [Parachlamydiales bacterium]|jgi:hypothetical protein
MSTNTNIYTSEEAHEHLKITYYNAKLFFNFYALIEKFNVEDWKTLDNSWKNAFLNSVRMNFMESLAQTENPTP